MTDYSTAASTVKTALDNVYVKKTDVVDNLSSTSTTNPLSANQGKELKQLIDTIQETIDSSSIHITANPPYLVSGGKTDLLVTLYDGLGSPLPNKSVSVSDGLSSYSGITNNNGTFLLEDMSNGSYIATYGTETDLITVPLCSFVDFGTSDKYSAWANSTTMSFSRDSVCTTVTPVNSSVFSSRYVTIPTGNCTIEFDVQCNIVSEAFFSVRQNSTSKASFDPTGAGISANTWYHIKININSTTVTQYTDGVLKSTKTADSHNRFYFTSNANVNKTIKYKNFIVY